jgi:hypothetical protein
VENVSDDDEIIQAINDTIAISEALANVLLVDSRDDASCVGKLRVVLRIFFGTAAA